MKNYLLILVVIIGSCNDGRQRNDIRHIGIFESTEIWDLAKAAGGNAKNFKDLAFQFKDKLNFQEEQYGLTLLMWCVKMEKYELAKILLEHGADPNRVSRSGKTALFYATEYSWLDNDADPDAKFVNLLLGHQADPNIVYAGTKESNLIDDGTSPLIHAASRSFAKGKAPVDGGADVNYMTDRGWTAANQALLAGDVQTAHYLIVDRKANVSQPYYYYHTGSDSINYQDTRYPVELLREWIFDLDSEDYKLKMEIVDEFSRQGSNYWKTTPSVRTVDRIKKLYPDTWEDYLSRY